MLDNKFIIFSAGRNCEKYVPMHIKTIDMQTYKNYEHIIVDDKSTDNTYKRIIANANEKTTVFKNEEKRQWWIENAITHLKVEPNDIVVVVDLDDWLMHDHVLENLNKIYNESSCWLTYGSFVWFTKRIIEGESYPKEVVDEKLFRQYKWLAVHLQTFRGFLWNNLNKDDLKFDDDSYIKAAYDQAIMMPMLEMCPADKIKFIEEPIYVYNDMNPRNVMKTRKEYQISCEKYVRGLPKYEELWIDEVSQTSS